MSNYSDKSVREGSSDMKEGLVTTTIISREKKRLTLIASKVTSQT